MLFLEGGDAADTRPEYHPHALGIDGTGPDPGSRRCLERGVDGVVDEGVVAAHFPVVEGLTRIEPLELAGDLHLVPGGVPTGDFADA